MVPVSEGGVCLRIDISTARVATNSGIFWWVEEEEEEEEEGAPPLCDQGAVSDRTALFL